MTHPEPTPIPPHSRPDLCVFIGRFQPFHAGHATVVEHGLKIASRLLVLVGSTGGPRTLRDPFTAAERIGVIRQAFADHPRLQARALEDSLDDLPDWLARTRQAVAEAWQAMRATDPGLPFVPRVALIGHAKDATSYYLKLFPQWQSIDVPQAHALSATDMRNRMWGSLDTLRPALEARLDALVEALPAPLPARERLAQAEARLLSGFGPFYDQAASAQALAFLASPEARALLPAATVQFLEAFQDLPAHRDLLEEARATTRTRWQWRHSPYAPQSITADALVFCDGHVLMIRRARAPGKGLWALPGGFVEPDERLLPAALRELAEETGVVLPIDVATSRLIAQGVFDDPFRSSRGRTLTHAFAFGLPGPLPALRPLPADDAEALALAWVPLEKIRRQECFEDHYAIIHRLLAQARAAQ